MVSLHNSYITHLRVHNLVYMYVASHQSDPGIATLLQVIRLLQAHRYKEFQRQHCECDGRRVM